VVQLTVGVGVRGLFSYKKVCVDVIGKYLWYLTLIGRSLVQLTAGVVVIGVFWYIYVCVGVFEAYGWYLTVVGRVSGDGRSHGGADCGGGGGGKGGKGVGGVVMCGVL